MTPKVDISSELRFRTARSGGKGGQNVNKVETSVEGSFDVKASEVLSGKQQQRILEKLSGRINKSGQLLVRSQETRSQLQNKSKVTSRMNELVNEALRPTKKRKPTRPPAAANEKRLRKKKRKGEKKQERQKDFLTDL